MPKCKYCGRTPGEHGVTLLRQNPKGEAGEWACEACNRLPVDAETAGVVALLQAAGQARLQ